MVALIACAAKSVVYPYYGMELPGNCYTDGKLLGKLGDGGWPDLPLSECTPDANVKGKCWIERTADHFAKEKDLEDCHIALDACQHPQPNGVKL